jgi:hypothetical protein
MDRLTTENGMCRCFPTGKLQSCYPDEFCPEECLNKRIMKLAAYENTNLAPEEIKALHDDYLDIDNSLRTANTEIKRLRRLLKMTNDILIDEQIEWDYADEVEEVLKDE